MKDNHNWILYYYLICVGAGPAFAFGQYYYATGKIFSWYLLVIIPGGILVGLLYGTILFFSVSFVLIIIHAIFDDLYSDYLEHLRQKKIKKYERRNDFHVQVVHPYSDAGQQGGRVGP